MFFERGEYTKLWVDWGAVFVVGARYTTAATTGSCTGYACQRCNI
jgi:hypothetical protein